VVFHGLIKLALAGSSLVALQLFREGPDFRFGSWPCKNVWGAESWGRLRLPAFLAGYAFMAAISGRTPIMLITLVML
jgi:hypothetical protein